MLAASCGGGEEKPAPETKKDSARSAAPGPTETTAPESGEKNTSMENNDQNGAAWEDVGGVKVRKNPTVKAQLEGNSYVKYDSYNSGGGAGGYSSEARMTFCPGGKMSMYTQSVTTINVEGAGGNSASEENDDGSFDVYEDEKGNIFLKVKMRKNGEGFIHIRMEGSKIFFDDGRSFSRKAGGC